MAALFKRNLGPVLWHNPLPLSILNPSLPTFFNYVLCLAWIFSFSFWSDYHNPQVGKDATSLSSHKTRQKGVLIHIPGVLFLNVTLHLNPFRRSIHYLVRQLTIAAAIVMTMNDIYEMIQRFQNAFFLFDHSSKPENYLLSSTFYSKHIGKLRDLSKDMEFRGQIFRCQSPLPFSMKYFKTQ